MLLLLSLLGFIVVVVVAAILVGRWFEKSLWMGVWTTWRHALVLPKWDPPRYATGTVFHSTDKETYTQAAILVRVSLTQCMLICLPGGNRWSDVGAFDVSTEHDGPTKEEFHNAFDDKWEVSRRGKEALEEWARTEI